MITSSLPLIGLFGGTFDPVHNGHLAVAFTLLQNLPLTCIQFIPCRQPAHRQQPTATAEQRLEMLQLAIAGYDKIIINDIELCRQGPSYMVDTLAILRKQYPNAALALIIGGDVLTTLNQWHEWQRLLELAHLIVVNRPSYILPKATWLSELLTQHACSDSNKLLQKYNGYILQQSIPPQSISASIIREQLPQDSTIISAVPPAVAAYIQDHHLYQ